MTRMIVAIPAGLIAGAVVGLIFGGLWLQWQLGANHPQAQGKPETQQDGTGNHVGRETAAAIKASVGHIALIQDHSRGPFGLTFSTI